VLAYLVICVFMYFYQYHLIYMPSGRIERTPASAGLQYEDVRLRTADGVSISAWHILRPDNQGTLILCHGNAGNMTDRISIARAFHEMGLSVLMLDYRGYGTSEGSPDEAGTYADAEAAWDYVTRELGIPPHKVIIYGESLGGAVAVELATRHEAAALIVEASFTSLCDVASTVYPFLPVRLLARARYKSIDKVGQITYPKLHIHSPDDDIVPFELGKRLFEAAAEPKQMIVTRGGHNDGGFTQREQYVREVRTFVREALSRVAAPSDP
jgi:fermentation-respiration switch protein FrsA (DUF1100 family)